MGLEVGFQRHHRRALLTHVVIRRARPQPVHRRRVERHRTRRAQVLLVEHVEHRKPQRGRLDDLLIHRQINTRVQVKHRTAFDLLLVGQIAIETADIFACNVAVEPRIVIPEHQVEHVFRHVGQLLARGW